MSLQLLWVSLNTKHRCPILSFHELANISLFVMYKITFFFMIVWKHTLKIKHLKTYSSEFYCQAILRGLRSNQAS